MIEIRTLVAIFVGGSLGGAARTALVQVAGGAPGSWPWVTFAVNVAGAAILGYAVSGIEGRVFRPVLRRRFIGTGFCGALTTFSTLQLEMLQMLDRGRIGLALGYMAASLAGGLALVRLTSTLARRQTA